MSAKFKNNMEISGKGYELAIPYRKFSSNIRFNLHTIPILHDTINFFKFVQNLA